jgi:RND family efflux transporter MFP subunit
MEDSVAIDQSPVPRRPGFFLRSRRKTVGAIGVILLLAFAWSLLTSRSHSGEAATLRPVAVVKVDRENLNQTLTLAAEFRPYQEVSLHAKVSGYVQSISVDVGDRVKEGQVLARLDVPEIKNDLEKDQAAVEAARQEVNRAQASYDQTHIASARLEAVAQQHPKLVAEQEVDDAKAKDQNVGGQLAAAKQHVDEAMAQLHKTENLLNYADITVPFDAVVTHRYVDTGALIQAGTSNSQTTPIVDIEEESRLRLIFPVPESAVARIRLGQMVHVSVSAVHQEFDAKVSRFSDKVDRETRTMRTEVDVENPDGALKPGMFAEATVEVEERKGVVTVPVEAVSAGEKPSVLTVNHSGVVKACAISLGLTTPSRIEILHGLLPGDLVVVGSRAGVRDGDKVAPKVITLSVN